MVSAKIVSTGAIRIKATTRGMTRKLILSTEMTSRALNSSLTAMVPISAARALPTVALKMIAVINGPISRAMVTATTMPTWFCWP